VTVVAASDPKEKTPMGNTPKIADGEAAARRALQAEKIERAVQSSTGKLHLVCNVNEDLTECGINLDRERSGPATEWADVSMAVFLGRGHRIGRVCKACWREWLKRKPALS
jgi:hypothetical protein